MRPPTLLLSLAMVAIGAMGSLHPAQHGDRHLSVKKREDNSTMIRKYGMVLFPAFDPQDVFGPLEVLELLAHDFQMDLYLLAETLDPVSTKPASPSMNPANSSFWPVILPSHTFADDPDLDVLIVPGGPGVRSPNLNSTMDYISRTYPKVKFLITICTGSGLVAKTGILDGRRATTNKSSWPGIVLMGPQVNWVSPARWVEDDEIWSSSGVTAGIDLMYAFVKRLYPDGEKQVERISRLTEYEVNENPCWDPFAGMNGIPEQNQPYCG